MNFTSLPFCNQKVETLIVLKLESEEAEEISFKTPKLAVDLFSTEF